MLLAGWLRAEAQGRAGVGARTERGVNVTAQTRTTLDIVLPHAANEFLRIEGPSVLAVGQTARFPAVVGDPLGQPVENPGVRWLSTDTIVAAAPTVGVRWGPRAVASVTLQPGTATIPVGDSLAIAALLLDSSGMVLTGRAIAWGSSDSSVVGFLSGWPVGGTGRNGTWYVDDHGNKRGTRRQREGYGDPLRRRISAQRSRADPATRGLSRADGREFCG